MKALNKKDRQTAIFKFSLIYTLSIGLLAFFFWQVGYVPKKVVGDLDPIQGEDFHKLKKESDFLKDEIRRANEYVETCMGSLSEADEKLEFYYNALMTGGQQAKMNKDARINKSVAKAIIDSMAYVISEGYKVKEIPVEDKETPEEIISKATKSFGGVMKSFVSELANRNEKNKHLIHYADDYFNCIGEVDKNCGEQLAQLQVKVGILERELTNRDQIEFALNTKLDQCKEDSNGPVASDCCGDLQDCKDASADCHGKRTTLKDELEKTENKLKEMSNTLGGPKDKKEARDLIKLSNHLLEVRQQN